MHLAPRLLRSAASTALAALSALVASTGACGAPSNPADAGTDAAPADSAPADSADPDASFATAAHDPLPQVPSIGGPIIAHPQLVLVTFADDPDAAAHEANARWIVTSDWLRATGTEYGVGAGSVLGVVNRTDNAPNTITDAQVQQLLADAIRAGTLPHPAGADAASVIYTLYLPAHTVATHPSGRIIETSCRQFGAYHSMAHMTGLDFAYMVIAGCNNLLPPLTQQQHAQFYLSHELIEAATDPDPARAPAFTIDNTDPPSAWRALVGGELADLCTISPEYLTESGYIASRVWSNAVAAAGRDNPCVPQSPGARYFNMSASPSYISAPAGQLTTVELRGWSNGPVDDWQVSFIQRGEFTPALMVRSRTLNNGGSTQLGVTIPAGTPSGAQAIVVLFADGGTAGQYGWPMLVVAQ